MNTKITMFGAKFLAVAALATTFALAPATAKAQAFAVGVQYGQPAYHYNSSYAYGNDGYRYGNNYGYAANGYGNRWDHERMEQARREQWQRERAHRDHEFREHHQDYDRRDYRGW